MTKEQKFFNTLRDIFIGAKVEGESGYINLMRIKSRYYEKGVFPKLQKDIDEALKPFPNFREELFEKLYTFFQRYFSESGSIYFRYTPLHQNIYEKVYTDDKDVMLFWKTHMLYYVKTDRLFKNLKVEVNDFNFFFDVSDLEYKRANEKKEIVYEFKNKREDETIVFNVYYSERGKKTKIIDILRALKKEELNINEDILDKAFKVFEKQNEIDYFINKDAKTFLREQFDIWLYQYVFSGESEWSEERIKQLQILKDIAFKIIDFISQFEDELVKIWNKPKFVLNSNYVITLDRIADKNIELVEKTINHKNIDEQIKEWKKLGIINNDFAKTKIIENNLMGKQLNKKYKYLPIDTKYFKDLELEILGLFDDLDNMLDGWLIKSENYQALNTILPKFKEKVQTIYIDPPFNSPSSEIIYVNQYKDSSWLTLMENRLRLSKQLLDKKVGVHCIAIDKNEQEKFGVLLENIFLEYEKTNITIVHNPRGVQGDNFSFCNENTFFLIPNGKKLIGNLKRRKIENRYLRDNGGESLRTDAKNCFYPIYVKNNKITGFGEVCKDSFHPRANQTEKDGVIAVYPIDNNGMERKWRYARHSIEEIEHLLNIKDIRGKIEIYKYKKEDRVRTVWTDSRYDANEYGKKLLNNIIPNCEFDFPKSIYNVFDCISISLNGAEKGVVLDYFAGSGTTVHALMKYNKEHSSKVKAVIIELGSHFESTILTRTKKLMFCEEWKEGIPKNDNSFGGFFKYYELEQYEDTLRKVKYEDSDLFNNPYEDPYNQYVFMRDSKMLDALKIDYKNNKVKVDLSKLYKNIDIPETLSNLFGKWIKKISPDYVEFEDGEKINIKDLDYKIIKSLIWW
jgi:adenine specific DNA methylase Mod